MADSGNKNPEIVSQRRNEREFRRILMPLACMVVLVMGVALMVPAISMTRGDLVCDMQEHAHSKACYEQVLTCGLEEGEGADPETGEGGHEHTKACYNKQLVCDIPEHKHTDACYEQVQNEGDSSSGSDPEKGDGFGEDGSNRLDADANDSSTSDDAGQATDDSDSAGLDNQSGSGDGQDENGNLGEGESAADPEMPALTFTADLKDADGNSVLTVSVDAPEGAFRKDVTMKIDGVPASDVREQVEQAVRDAKGDNAVVKRMTAVDIIFVDAEGNEIEPAKKVDVKISSNDVREIEDPVLVHVIDKDKPSAADKPADVDAEVVQKVKLVNQDDADKSKGDEDTLKFKTDEFSPYVIVELEQIAADVLTADGKAYTITVSYDEDARIPEGAQLKVREIESGTEEYEGYLSDSAAELGVKSASISFARFFDIQITADGEKVEPQAPVQVSFAYKDSLEISEGGSLNVVHFAEEGSKVSPEVIADVSINDEANEITYEQASFSVTGTIITTQPQNNGQYAVIVKSKQYEDVYYAVQNDGSLLEVDYSAENNVAHVEMDYPIFWTYVQENGFWNLRIPVLAATFNYQNLPDNYYYRYIDPNAASGVTEEPNVMPDESTPKMGDSTYYECAQQVNGQHSQYVNSCAMYPFENNKIHGWTNYIGIDETKLQIIGNVSESDAATVYFARVEEVPESQNLNHTVNHIDISFEGNASISVPLAYGDYYYYDNEGNRQTLSVSKSSPVTLNLTKTVPITSEDLKHAQFTAFSARSGVLNNAYYITGYSQNAQNDVSSVQIRAEGSFLVADLDSPFPVASGSNPMDTEYRYLSESQLQSRLDNRVYYTVSLKSTMDFEWMYVYGTDGDGNPLTAQLYNPADDKPFSSKDVAVSLSKTFNYWDLENECPPMTDPNIALSSDITGQEGLDGTRAFWQKGHILWDTSGHNGSGMDFKLEAHTDLDANVVAIEIKKFLKTNDGQDLKPKTSVTNSFAVYQKTPATVSDINSVVGVGLGEENPQVNYDYYTGLHAAEVTVNAGESEALVYDYDVRSGMTYIVEDEGSIKKEIIDTSGQKWKYIGTRTETEYAWRSSEDYTGKRHVVDGVTSIPEVVGNYGTWVNASGEEEPLFNGFLEFDVYNIYEKQDDVVTLPVEKTWTDFTDAQYKWAAQFQLQYIERKIEGDGPDQSVTEWTDYVPEKILTINKDAVNQATVSSTFGDLPKYRVDENGNKYERQYSADELGFTVWRVVNGQDVLLYSFDGANYTYGEGADETAVYKPFFEHDANENWDGDWTLQISNSKAQQIEPRKIDITLEKEWSPSVPDGASAEFVLKRYVQTEYVDYTGHQADANITVELRDSNNAVLSSVQTKSGMNVFLDATFAPNKTDTFEFAYGGNAYTIANESASSSKVTKRCGPIAVSGSEGETVVITLQSGSLANLAEGNAYNIRVTDHLTGTDPAPDSGFSQTINLPVDGQWSASIPGLTVEDGEWNEHGTQANYSIYSYYLEEVSSTPDNYRCSVKDSAGNPISISNRMYNGDTITATNTEIGDHIHIEKRWYRLVANQMPPVVIRVTQTVNNQTSNVTQDAFDDSGNVVAYSEKYGGYILDEYNGWAINIEGLAPNVQRAYTEIGIINGGDPADGYESGSLMDIPTGATGYDSKHYYFSAQGIAPSEDNHDALVGQITTNQNSTDATNGTMFIYNVPNYVGYQVEVHKKWLEFNGQSGLSDITDHYGSSEGTGFIMQLQQRAKWYSTQEVASDWEDYGEPFEIYIDHNTADINGFEQVMQGTWLTTVDEKNLSRFGYLYSETAQDYESVEYEYRFVEAGVIDGNDGRIWSKSTSSTGDPDSTTNQSGHRYNLENFEVGQIELQKQWNLHDAANKASEVYFKIYSDWWFSSYDAEPNAQGKYDVADIIGRDINNPSLSLEEKAAVEEYWLKNGVTVKQVGDLGYVFAVSGTSDNWSGGLIRGLPLLKADPSAGGDAVNNTYGEVLYTVSEVGAWYNGALAKVGDSSWPYVEPLYYCNTRNQGLNLVGDGETFQIDNGTAEYASFFRVVNSDTPTWKFHADKRWDVVPEAGASVVLGLQAMKLKPEDVQAVFDANGLAKTAQQEAEGVKVSNLTQEQINALVSSDEYWSAAETDNPSVVLPKSWDYASMPDGTDEERAAKEAASAAWSVDWAALPMTWKSGILGLGEEYELLYRVVETSSPEWTAHTITSLTIGSNYTLSQTIRNTSEDATGDLQITKQWNGSTSADDWPEGYVIDYKVVQHAFLAKAEEQAGGDGSGQNQASAALTYSADTDKPLFDVDFTDYTSTYGETPNVQEATNGRIEKNQNPVTLHNLPKGEMWTAPEAEEDITEEMSAAGVQPGKTYSIAYAYEVVETGVTSGEETLPFNATSGILDVNTTSTGTLENNELTEIKVVKQWEDYTPQDGDYVGVKLYVSTTPPGQKEQTTFTVKVGNWLNDTVAPESGSVEVTLAASDGSTQAVTLNGPSWSQDVTVNKYGNDENGPEVTWQIQSVGAATGVPERVMTDTAVWEGHNSPTNSGTLELQATGEVRKNTGSITIENVDFDGTIQVIDSNYSWSGTSVSRGASITLNDLVEGQQYFVKLSGFANINGNPNPQSTYPDNVRSENWEDTQGYWITATSSDTKISLNGMNKRSVPVTITWGDSVPDGSSVKVRVDNVEKTLTKTNGSSTSSDVFDDLYSAVTYGVSYELGEGLELKNQTTQVTGETTSITATVDKMAAYNVTVNLVAYDSTNVYYWSLQLQQLHTDNWAFQRTWSPSTFSNNDTNRTSTLSDVPNGTYTMTVDSGSQNNSDYTFTVTGGTVTRSGNNWTVVVDGSDIVVDVTFGSGDTPTGVGNRALSARSALPSAKTVQPSGRGVKALRATATEPTNTTVALRDDAGNDQIATIVGSSDLPRGATCLSEDEVLLSADVDETTGQAWSHLWSDLPKKDGEGNTLYYYVVETSTNVTGTTMAATYSREDATETNPETITITNSVERPQYGSFQVAKAVEGVETDRSFTIRLKREKEGVTDWLIGAVGQGPEYSWGSEASATTWTFNAGGTVTFTGLDLGYTYTAVEDTGTGMVEVSGYDFQNDSTTTASAEVIEAGEYTGTITNKYASSASIKIIKVEKGHKDSQHTLSGATFQLTKVDEQGHDDTVNPYKSAVSPVDDNGELEFSDLAAGRYKLEEITPPTGYVLVETPWYLDVSAGTATLEMAYELASAVGEGHPSEFYIENTPGTALPTTGGSGVAPFTFVGVALMAFAGVGLVIASRSSRKRQPSDLRA